VSIDTPGNEPVGLVNPAQARYLAGCLIDWADAVEADRPATA